MMFPPIVRVHDHASTTIFLALKLHTHGDNLCIESIILVLWIGDDMTLSLLWIIGICN